MKRSHISRRDLFKLSALAGGSLALSTIVGPAPEQANASAIGPLADATPPAFAPMPSALAFGTPADVSMGWDGTVWAIGNDGAPHTYDAVANAWQPHGDGIDAVAYIGDLIYHFRGSKYVTVNFSANTANATQDIAATWPNLPYSFKLGVHGAANVLGKLYLFKGGLYVNASDTPSTTSKLTDLVNWPQVSNWKDGAIDAVMSDGSTIVFLFRGSEYIPVDLMSKRVLAQNPAPITNYVPWQGRLPAAWAATGIDGVFVWNTNNYKVYKGTAFVVIGSAGGLATQQYIGSYTDWPAIWNPRLVHAPSGRVGNLWAATATGGIVQHDGEKWSDQSLPNSAQAKSVAMGTDGVTYAATATTLHLLESGSWTPPLAAPPALSQVSIGDANHVWVRDGGNAVWVYDQNQGQKQFVPVAQVGTAVHMAANADGTLWHCAGSASAFRFISEGSGPTETIPVPADAQATVQKVASTGFGNGYCLTQTGNTMQLFTYSSNYVFKTAQSYNTNTYGQIAQGLGSLYFIISNAVQGGQQYAVVALDQLTGRERWTKPSDVSPVNVKNSGPVYDPNLKLLYVTSAPANLTDNSSSGWIIALDAQTGTIVWASNRASDGSTIHGIDAPPTLLGTQLCFGDRTGAVHMFDTEQALADDKSGKGAQAKWSVQGAGSQGIGFVGIPTPVISSGVVYFVCWVYSQSEMYFLQCNSNDGSSLQFVNVVALPVGVQPDQFVPAPPVLGQAGFVTDSNQPEPAIFVNTYNFIIGFSLTTQNVNNFAIPGGSAYFSSGMTYDRKSGLLWVGDSVGRLYGLDPMNGLQPVANTPVQPAPADAILTTPVVETDASSNTYVCFGTLGSAAHQLWIFNPSEPPGQANPASVDTGQTAITQLSRTVSNGVIYAAGNSQFNPTNKAAGQVFAINVDTATQALRDIIVESQMMQDFDDPPQGQTDPPTYSRYQTHITVVDDQHAPRANEAVKIWADQPTTISIDSGPPAQIGPGDDEYAVAQTGVDGVVTVSTGYLVPNASDPDGFTDGADYFAIPLRVWVGFMDPYERVVIYPDAEFHARITTAQNVTDTTNPAYDDPDSVNLHTAQNYAGAPFFTSNEIQQNQPQNIANAIQQMTKAVQVGGSGGSRSSEAKRGLAGAAAVEKYVPYDDLPGMSYFNTNVPANRSAQITQPVGLSYISDANDTVPSIFATLTHADATTAIDALTADKEWTPTLVGAQRVGGFWSSLWNWLKHAVVKITHIIISIGKEIYAGLRFIWNGVSYFFKQVLSKLEDVVSAIGAFFKKIGKDIKNIIEVLSILFNINEILATQSYLLQLIYKTRDSAQVAVQTKVPAAVNTAFTTIRDDLCKWFCEAKNDIEPGVCDPNACSGPTQGGSRPSNGLGNWGATPHSMFNVAPKTAPSAKKSHAVQCGWASQKFKANHKQATQPANVGASLPDTLAKVLSDFVNRLSSDPDLKSPFENTKAEFKKKFKFSNIADFGKTVLVVLLDIFEDLLLDAVEVVKDFALAFVDLAGDFISFLVGDSQGHTGIATEPIHIPVLSSLYNKALGQDLTLLNLMMFLLAIPTAIIYRAVEGQFLSKDISLSTSSTAGAESAKQASSAPLIEQRVAGVMGSLFAFVNSIVAPLADIIFVEEGKPATNIIGKISALLGAAQWLTGAIGGLANPSPSATDWVTFVWDLVTMFMNQILVPEVAPAVVGFGGLFRTGLSVFQKVDDKTGDSDADWLNFSSSLLAGVPSIGQLLKLAIEETEDLSDVLLGAIDFWFNLGSGACLLAATILTWDKNPTAPFPSRRTFLPWVASQPAVLPAPMLGR